MKSILFVEDNEDKIKLILEKVFNMPQNVINEHLSVFMGNSEILINNVFDLNKDMKLILTNNYVDAKKHIEASATSEDSVILAILDIHIYDDYNLKNRRIAPEFSYKLLINTLSKHSSIRTFVYSYKKDSLVEFEKHVKKLQKSEYTDNLPGDLNIEYVNVSLLVDGIELIKELFVDHIENNYFKPF